MSDRQALAALRTAPGQDVPSSRSGHAGKEPVVALATAALGLEGTLHLLVPPGVAPGTPRGFANKSHAALAFAAERV